MMHFMWGCCDLDDLILVTSVQEKGMCKEPGEAFSVCED